MKKIANLSKKIIRNPVKTLTFTLIIASIIIIFVFEANVLAWADIADFTNQLPQSADKKLVKVSTQTVPVTAYNSEPGQTDNTPCITANGFDLCKNNQENVIAANFLPFGTMVKFPDYDPNTIFTVQDRMNKRYPYRADIWMTDKKDAIKFGVKKLTMEIYQYE